MSDPRRRKDRHALTPDSLSSAIQLTNMPADWTQDTASSVVAGSGPIVDISTKTDPRTGRMSAAIFEYKTSKDCKRAYEILGRIENMPCSLERIIPQNYKLGAAVAKEELQLNRETFPWNCGLDLPFEMISEVPLPRKPSQTPAPPLNNSNNNGNNVSKSNNNIAFPDILRKASQHLPQLQPNVLSGTDPVSMNLSKIPPLQLIEIISNLKILANQDSTKRNQLESFLKTNLNISISVTQALLEMGFINYNVVTQVLKQRQGGNGFGSAVNSSSNTPVNHNIPMPVPMPIPPPFVAPQQQQQQAPPAPFGFVPPPMPFMPSTPAIGTPPPPMMTMPQLAPQPQQPPQTGINLGKLQALPQNQRDMIKQVLKFTDEQVRVLPPDQKTLVENLKKEYIL
ncbi:related to Protein PTI1 [Zygosaccharomyces bailii ISA1307]|nr:related to Protein PTI1 [Zygosaccharomyces bailii ISA1307]